MAGEYTSAHRFTIAFICGQIEHFSCRCRVGLSAFMGVFRNENAAERLFRATQQQEKCSRKQLSISQAKRLKVQQQLPGKS